MTGLSPHHFNPSDLLISPLYTDSPAKSKNLSVFPFSLDSPPQVVVPLHNIHATFFTHVCVVRSGPV